MDERNHGRNDTDERAAQATPAPGPQPAPDDGAQAGTASRGGTRRRWPASRWAAEGEAGQAGPDVRELQDRVQDLEDRWRRAMAELDNQRKRLRAAARAGPPR